MWKERKNPHSLGWLRNCFHTLFPPHYPRYVRFEQMVQPRPVAPLPSAAVSAMGVLPSDAALELQKVEKASASLPVVAAPATAPTAPASAPNVKSA
jgi:hypothetical protein